MPYKNNSALLLAISAAVFVLLTANGACLARDAKLMPGSVCVGTSSVQAAALSRNMAGVMNNSQTYVPVICPIAVDSDFIKDYRMDALHVVIEGTRVGTQSQAVICTLDALRMEHDAYKLYSKSMHAYGTEDWSIYFSIANFATEFGFGPDDHLVERLTAVCTLPSGATLHRIRLTEDRGLGA